MAFVKTTGTGTLESETEIVFPDSRKIRMFTDNRKKILVSSVGSPHVTMAVTALVDCAQERLAEPGSPFLDTEAIMSAAAHGAADCDDVYAYLVALPKALKFDEVGRGSTGDAFG